VQLSIHYSIYSLYIESIKSRSECFRQNADEVNMLLQTDALHGEQGGRVFER